MRATGLDRRWLLWIALGVWCLWWCGAAHAQPAPSEQCVPQILSIRSAQGTASEAVPAEDSEDAHQWVDVQLPDRWRTRWPDYDGAVWYHIRWHAPCADAAGAAGALPVVLGINSISSAGEVYSNADLIWRDQSLQEPLSRSWNMPRTWLLPASSLRAGADNDIWVRVHGLAQDDGGLSGQIILGHPAEVAHWLKKAWWDQRSLIAINMTVSGVLMLLFTFAWAHRPSTSVYGWYAFNCMSWVIMLGLLLMSESAPFPSSNAVTRAGVIAFILFTFSFNMFVWRFGRQRFPRIELLWWLAAAAALGVVIFFPTGFREASDLIGMCCLAFTTGNVLQFVVHAWRSKKLEQQVFAGCLIMFMLVAVHDFLSLLGVNPTSSPLIPYTAPVTMLALSMMLGRQIMLNIRRIERFNEELAQSVTLACDELSNTLAREHELALSHSRLQERMRLSQDLHDSLGGSLVRSIAYVEQSEQPLRNMQFLSMLKLMRDDLRQMIDTSTSGAITTPATPTEWAAPLRYRFVGLFDELDIHSVWEIPAAWYQPPGPLQCLALTRLVEEALTNVIKHSRARQVHIALRLPNAELLELEITDNGVGFDMAMIESGSMGVGIRSMRARVERMGGRMEISSAEGGTHIQVQMPLAYASTSGMQEMFA